MDAIGNFLTGNSGAIGSALGTGAQLYGQQNAAQAITDANTTAANTQQQYLGTAGQYYQPYLNTGTSAANALTQAQSGGPGGTPDYSGFMNMPGYQFAIQQGQQAAERQAAAMGNAGNSGTSAMIGNQVAGTAMQDYNTYIQQLQASAGIGAGAANQIGNLTYNTGANISQLAANSGQAMAGMYTGMGQTVGGALGAGSPYYGAGGTGTTGTGAGGGLSGLIGKGIGAIGGWLGGGSGTPDYTDPSAGMNSNTGAGFIAGGGYGGSDYSPYVSAPETSAPSYDLSGGGDSSVPDWF
jgi:hypothetical protein